MARAAARVYITADSAGVRRGTQDAERALSRLNRSGTAAFTGLKVAALGFGAAVTVGLASALRTGIGELQEASEVGARTANVLQTTGGAANVTKKEIEGLAAALERKTGIDGDAIQSGQNLLLTFTSIRNEAGKGNDVFNQATKAALDMSVAFKQDLSASSIQLGKALNDPVKGVSALQRVGVSFTAAQKEQIKTLVESGRTLDAQKLILRELNTQVGGAAEAYGNTLPGQVEKAKRAWEGVTAQMATALLPALTEVVRFTNERLLPAMQEAWPTIERTIRRVIDWIGQNVVPVVRETVDTAKRLWDRHSEDVKAALGKVRAYAEDNLGFVKEYAVTLGRLLGDGSVAWEEHGGTVRRVLRVLDPLVRFVMESITRHMRIVVSLVNGDWKQAGEDLLGYWADPIMALVRVVQRAAPEVLSAVGALARKVPEVMRGQITKLPGILRDALVRMVEAAANAVVTASAEIGKAIPRAIAAGIGSTGSVVGRAITGLLPDWANPLDAVRGRGGYVGGPGPANVDSQRVLARPDETILTPEQVGLVEQGYTVDEALRMTGGQTSGRRFARGGYVSAAAKRARDNLGEPYGKPSRGQSRTGPNSWDCSGYATMVAGVDVGGTTRSAYAASTPAKGDEPIVWGFRKSHSGAYRGGYDEHMGVRVAGVWYQTSNGRTAQTGSDGQWQELRVPKGLGGLSGTDASDGDGSETDNNDDFSGVDVEEIRNRAGEIVGYKTSDGRRYMNPTGARRRRLQAANARTGRQRVAAVRQGARLLGMRPTTPETYRDRITAIGRDDSLQDRIAGDQAEAGARRAGVDNPEKLAAIRQLAVNRQRKQDLDRILSELRAEEDRVGGRIGRLEAGKRSWFAALRKARTPARRAECLNRIRELNAAILDADAELRGIGDEIADVVVQMRELGYDTQVAEATVASAPDRASTGTAGSDAGPGAEPTLTPEQAAAVNTGIANEDFLRTVFGPGDIGMGGSNAWNAASPRWVTIRVDRDSFGSAVGSSMDGQGAVPATVVPSGA